MLLLHSPHADQWLKASAISKLLLSKPMTGFDVALEMLDTCVAVQLEEIIVAANDEYQGDLRDALLLHPLIQRLKKRLQEPEMKNLPFVDLFFENFA